MDRFPENPQCLLLSEGSRRHAWTFVHTFANSFRSVRLSLASTGMRATARNARSTVWRWRRSRPRLVARCACSRIPLTRQSRHGISVSRRRPPAVTCWSPSR